MKKKRPYEKPMLENEKLENNKQGEKEEKILSKEKDAEQKPDSKAKRAFLYLRSRWKNRKAMPVVAAGLVLCIAMSLAFQMDQEHPADGTAQNTADEDINAMQDAEQRKTMIGLSVQDHSAESQTEEKSEQETGQNTSKKRVEESSREKDTEQEKTETEAESVPAVTATPVPAENAAVSTESETTDAGSLPYPTVMPTQAVVQDTPATAPVHTHTWIPQIQTVHHDAVKESVYVVDQPAYEEAIYGDEPVYETYGVEICGGCGTELHSSLEVRTHAETHIDWETLENPFYYYTEQRQRQTGTKRVQTGTIHHEEVGHYEERILQSAYEETVITGYVCAGCGAIQ